MRFKWVMIGVFGCCHSHITRLKHSPWISRARVEWRPPIATTFVYMHWRTFHSWHVTSTNGSKNRRHHSICTVFVALWEVWTNSAIATNKAHLFIHSSFRTFTTFLLGESSNRFRSVSKRIESFRSQLLCIISMWPHACFCVNNMILAFSYKWRDYHCLLTRIWQVHQRVSPRDWLTFVWHANIFSAHN